MYYKFNFTVSFYSFNVACIIFPLEYTDIDKQKIKRLTQTPISDRGDIYSQLLKFL